MSEALKSMPLLDHLKALRKVLAVSFGVLIVGTLLCWAFSERILVLITELLPNEEAAHIFSPPEAFLIRLKV
ncbi:MAG: twin-arginine translocase subunit TatC, partial [Candidatus Krumholzibacteria bacterium]|nr:twin-arginine translocase subunit TatC [Candidatus Krumholzibacteria bacterium]